MPELPEVETIRRTLIPAVQGKKIVHIDLFSPSLLRGCEPQQFLSSVLGKTVFSLQRKGKYLFFVLSGGSELKKLKQENSKKKSRLEAVEAEAVKPVNKLVVHLGMTGRLLLFLADESQENPVHTHAVFYFEDGNRLLYCDPRRFGFFSLDFEPCLGIEPLGRDFTEEKLVNLLAGRRSKIKLFLMDQRFLAGIGNIYADEILHAAGIRPDRLAGSLSAGEVKLLYKSIRRVLREGVKQRGTSISDYVDGKGEQGRFQNFLQVYGRAGEACFCCGSVIERIKLGGRSSCFCPQCQR